MLTVLKYNSMRTFLPLFLLCFLWLSTPACARQSVDDSTTTDSTHKQLTPADFPDYRQYMRDFVIDIAGYSRKQDPDFIIIPQNGHELVVKGDETARTYVDAIDGMGQENLFYGYNGDYEATPDENREYMIPFLETGKRAGKTVLITDYVNDEEKMKASYTLNSMRGFLSFAAPDRDLRVIPGQPASLPFENGRDIRSLNEAKNFLYMLNFEYYDDKEALLADIATTNYDALIIDAFYHDSLFTPADLASLKVKANGGQRLVISYMSIGEAEDYRYYWNPEWVAEDDTASFIQEENPNWEGNYKVRYWDTEWKQVITGNKDSYLHRIINAGFDGVYLDIIDGFWYFENKMWDAIEN